MLREFLKCGLLEHGFARLWCGECRSSVLVAFSCRGRSFCPSCEKKKQLLWAECSRMNPSLGRNFEAMDPLEWLARMSDHIPDPGQHRTIFYGEYSSRARAGCRPLEPDDTSTTADHPPPRRRCPPSWARLIAKVYQVDPLVCTRCAAA